MIFNFLHIIVFENEFNIENTIIFCFVIQYSQNTLSITMYIIFIPNTINNKVPYTIIVMDISINKAPMNIETIP